MHYDDFRLDTRRREFLRKQIEKHGQRGAARLLNLHVQTMIRAVRGGEMRPTTRAAVEAIVDVMRAREEEET